MSRSRLLVLECGPSTSLQDSGRRGYLRDGLSGSGPMDPLAFAVANTLVGNAPDTVAIEFGLCGGRFRVQGSARIALAGAPCPLGIDGEAVPMHASLDLSDGGELRLERPREGVFAYLAVAGGIDVSAVMGSRSLHRRAALGGLDGRGLRAGDALRLVGEAPSGTGVAIAAPPLDRDAPIRVVLGPQDDRFAEAGLNTFLGESFTVSNRVDRMGYQLEGPSIAHGEGGYNIVSDATVAGSIQVPGSGQPIVLLADRQTTGGYPKIATVISADLRRIAQRRPGERVRFEAVDLAQAVRLARAQAATIADLPRRLGPASDAIDRLLTANVAGHAVDALGDP